MSETVTIHIVQSDENPNSLCKDEPFDVTSLEGHAIVHMCRDCLAIIDKEIDEENKEVLDGLRNDRDGS